MAMIIENTRWPVVTIVGTRWPQACANAVAPFIPVKPSSR